MMQFRPLVNLKSIVLASRRLARSRTVVTRGSGELAKKLVRNVKRLNEES